MQAKDIPDETVLDIVRRVNDAEDRWCLIWDLEEGLPGVPRKVITAKCRALIRKDKISGCTCGCRGDYVIRGHRHDWRF
jgi:hypothetical protein